MRAIRGARFFLVGLCMTACDSPTAPEGPTGEIVVSRVYAGNGFSCGLGEGGRALCWGLNDQGQLGTASPPPGFQFGPRAISDLISFQRLATKAAGRHVCGLASSGETYCWGENDYGQLGFGERSRQEDLRLVEGGRAFTSITAGWRSSCGITADGEAYCWGRGVWGQLGDGLATLSPVPVPVSGGHKFRKIDVGSNNLVCGLVEDGRILCWGLDLAGALGSPSTVLCDNGGPPLRCATIPQPITSEERFVELSAGSSFACGVTRSFEALCWGRNDVGQLGRPTTETCFQSNVQPIPCGSTPAPVSGPQRFVMVSAGPRHACGVTVDGDAYCWGENSIGELGNGTVAEFSNVPQRVRGGLAFKAVSAGDQHSCGEAADGRLYCWGSNLWGQLGTGDTRLWLEPALVVAGG